MKTVILCSLKLFAFPISGKTAIMENLMVGKCLNFVSGEIKI